MDNGCANSGRKSGFTLVELLVAMAMALMVLSIMFTMFRTSNRSYILQDRVAEMQQNLRVAMYTISRDVRMAGCGLNLLDSLVEGLGIQVFDGAGWTMLQGITATNSSTGPDSIQIFYGDVQSGNYDATITAGMPDASAELNVDTVANFQIDDMVVVTDGSTACLFVVSAIQGAALKLQHNPAQSIFNPPAAFKAFPFGGGYDAGSRLFNFGNGKWVNYFIDSTTDPDHPTLKVDFLDGLGEQIVADNIEDIQFSYFLDGVALPVDDPTGQEDDIVAVRINIVARVDREDMDVTSWFKPLDLEDHVHTAPPTDGYQRRVLSTVVKVRNN